jgi:hypothetical protein
VERGVRRTENLTAIKRKEKTKTIGLPKSQGPPPPTKPPAVGRRSLPELPPKVNRKVGNSPKRRRPIRSTKVEIGGAKVAASGKKGGLDGVKEKVRNLMIP